MTSRRRSIRWGPTTPFSERHGATIHSHPAVAERLRKARVEPIEGELPGGARAFPIGKPRRHETPIHLPSHKALAFGDAVVTTPGDLRLWHVDRVDAERARWYRERFAPTLAAISGGFAKCPGLVSR